MKIIDFERKGNIVRFYLGADNCQDYWGDDWNDTPYECNAGRVYERFVLDHKDVAFNFDDLVLEPCDGIWNSNYCKEDMKNRMVPCLIVVPAKMCIDSVCDSFEKWVCVDGIKKYYFGDMID